MTIVKKRFFLRELMGLNIFCKTVIAKSKLLPWQNQPCSSCHLFVLWRGVMGKFFAFFCFAPTLKKYLKNFAKLVQFVWHKNSKSGRLFKRIKAPSFLTKISTYKVDLHTRLTGIRKVYFAHFRSTKLVGFFLLKTSLRYQLKQKFTKGENKKW